MLGDLSVSSTKPPATPGQAGICPLSYPIDADLAGKIGVITAYCKGMNRCPGWINE